MRATSSRRISRPARLPELYPQKSNSSHPLKNISRHRLFLCKMFTPKPLRGRYLYINIVKTVVTVVAPGALSQETCSFRSECLGIDRRPTLHHHYCLPFTAVLLTRSICVRVGRLLSQARLSAVEHARVQQLAVHGPHRPVIQRWLVRVSTDYIRSGADKSNGIRRGSINGRSRFRWCPHPPVLSSTSTQREANKPARRSLKLRKLPSSPTTGRRTPSAIRCPCSHPTMQTKTTSIALFLSPLHNRWTRSPRRSSWPISPNPQGQYRPRTRESTATVSSPSVTPAASSLPPRSLRPIRCLRLHPHQTDIVSLRPALTYT